jgi:hypothetical protein
MPDARSHEANLLFQSPIAADPARLATDVHELALAHGLNAEIAESAGEQFQLFDCGTLQILVAGCAQPLDVSHFLDVARPDGASLSETAILSRLTGHRYSVTVLVADHPDRPEYVADETAAARRTALKERLCWQLTELMRARHRPALVFWADTDTLYAGEEFARASLIGAGRTEMRSIGPASLEEGERQMAQQRSLERMAMTYIQTQIIQGAHRRRAPRHPIVEQLTGRLGMLEIPAQQAIALAKRHQHQMMRGTTMACSTAAIGICKMPGLLNLAFG